VTMSDQSDYLTTVKELMRLTRNGKIQWEEKDPVHANALPSYEGQYSDLLFRLEDAISSHSATDYVSGRADLASAFDVKYRLIIKDQADLNGEQSIMSPPMTAVTDLVRVAQNMLDEEQSASGEQKLRDINRRLAES